MKILRLSTLTLGLAIAVFALGYANPSFAAPKNCVMDDPRPSCPKEDPEPDPDPTAADFSVVLDLNGDDSDDGGVVVTEVKINGNRQGLNGTMARPALVLLPTSGPGLPCTITWNDPALAQFSISTAKIPPSSEFLTYVEANIYGFTLSTFGDARFTLGFVPNKDLTFKDRLFPTKSNTSNELTGNKIGVSISPDHGSCSGTITQEWTITVTKD